MMKYCLIGATLMSSSLLLLSLANATEDNKATPPTILYQPLFASKVAYAATKIIDNKVVTLSAKKGQLVFAKDDKTVMLSNKGISNKNIWLHQNPNNIYALWWTKGKQGKALHLRRSNDKGETFQAPVRMTLGGILPILSLADDNKDKIAIAYVNEREAGYQIYFNRSLDAGKTWLKQDQRLNDLYNTKGKVTTKEAYEDKKDIPGSRALSPHLSYLGDDLVIQWQEQSLINKVASLRIVSRVSKDDGLTWGEEQEIYKIDNQNPTEMRTVQVGTELYSFLFVPKKGILVFSSTEKGSKWQQEKTIPNTAALVFASGIKTFLNKNKLFLTFTQREKQKKDGIELYVLDLSSKQWARKTGDLGLPLYPKDRAENTKTKTVNATLTGLKNGIIVVAWEDHRYLMPTVMLNASKDGGETWLKTAFPLLKPGKVISKFPSLLAGDDKFFMIFTYSNTEGVQVLSQSLYLATLATKPLASGATLVLPPADIGEIISDKDKIARLKQRADAFWTLRIEEKYAETFAYFDPLYRTLFDKNNFLKSQGKIKFIKYAGAEITLHGLIGVVDTDVEFTIPMFATLGGVAEAPPPQKRKMNARWGWFYDNWYLMPETMFDRRYEF